MRRKRKRERERERERDEDRNREEEEKREREREREREKKREGERERETAIEGGNIKHDAKQRNKRANQRERERETERCALPFIISLGSKGSCFCGMILSESRFLSRNVPVPPPPLSLPESIVEYRCWSNASQN